jgi:hypothetical protein
MKQERPSIYMEGFFVIMKRQNETEKIAVLKLASRMAH